MSIDLWEKHGKTTKKERPAMSTPDWSTGFQEGEVWQSHKMRTKQRWHFAVAKMMPKFDAARIPGFDAVTAVTTPLTLHCPGPGLICTESGSWFCGRSDWKSWRGRDARLQFSEESVEVYLSGWVIKLPWIGVNQSCSDHHLLVKKKHSL